VRIGVTSTGRDVGADRRGARSVVARRGPRWPRGRDRRCDRRREPDPRATAVRVRRCGRRDRPPTS